MVLKGSYRVVPLLGRQGEQTFVRRFDRLGLFVVEHQHCLFAKEFLHPFVAAAVAAVGVVFGLATHIGAHQNDDDGRVEHHHHRYVNDSIFGLVRNKQAKCSCTAIAVVS